MTSYIGYNNLVRSGVVTVTSEAVGFEKENAQSWKTSTWWQAAAAGTVYFYVDMGSAVNVDCWGIVGHNLAANSGTAKPQYSATGAWAGEEVDLDTVQTPTGTETIFRKVTNANARYFRLAVGSTGNASFIANIFFGVALALERELPPGFSPAILNRDRDIFNNKSEGGQHLGRVLRAKGGKFTIEQNLVSKSWIDANWLSLADSIELYPFYFTWDSENNADEAQYCITDRITYPTYAMALYQNFAITGGAIYDI